MLAAAHAVRAHARQHDSQNAALPNIDRGGKQWIDSGLAEIDRRSVVEGSEDLVAGGAGRVAAGVDLGAGRAADTEVREAAERVGHGRLDEDDDERTGEIAEPGDPGAARGVAAFMHDLHVGKLLVERGAALNVGDGQRDVGEPEILRLCHDGSVPSVERTGGVVSDGVHRYAATCAWAGSTAAGYEAYDRAHSGSAPPAEATVTLSSDPAFRGDPRLLNPEQLLVLAASSIALVALPNPRTALGKAQLSVEAGGRSLVRTSVTVVALDVTGPTKPLAAGKKGILAIEVNGTDERVVIEVRNLSPDVVSLPQGNVFEVKTSGGKTNVAKIGLSGVKTGNYAVSAHLVSQVAGAP